MKIEIDGKEYIEKDTTKSQNSGDWNSGDGNSGNWNSGYRNSGTWNSGDGNSGDRNSGNWNSGNWNSGDGNSGTWNSGDWSSGFLNTTEAKVRIFNKETNIKRENISFPNYFYFNLTEWIEPKDMNDEEKKKYPNYSVTNGFLRVFDYKTAWKNSFDKATKEDIALTLKLPNFNFKLFFEITGITKKMIQERLK